MLKNFNKTLIKNHFYQPKLKKDFSTISYIKKPFNNTFPITNTKNYLNKSCINYIWINGWKLIKILLISGVEY